MEDIRKNDIAIIKDVLVKKKTEDNQNRKEYLLYFKDYYDRTGKTIKVNRTTYSKAFKDNDYYIVFKRDNNENPSVYKKDADNLDKETLKCQIDIKLLGYFLDDEDLIMTQNNTHKFLNKDDLNRDITKDDFNILKSLIIIILIFPLFILFMGLASLNIRLIIVSILLFISSFLVLYAFNYKKIKISNQIKNGKFKIQIDKIESINKSLDFRSTYLLRTLTFKKCNKEIRVPKRDFLEVKKGDKVYLVLDNKKNIITCYNAKYVQFDKDLEEYINE